MQSGMRKGQILRYVRTGHYDYKWQPVLSYLQLKPSDFDSNLIIYHSNGIDMDLMLVVNMKVIIYGWVLIMLMENGLSLFMVLIQV